MASLCNCPFARSYGNYWKCEKLGLTFPRGRRPVSCNADVEFIPLYSHLSKDLLEYLHAHPEGVTLKELRRTFGLQKKPALNYVKRLMKEGIVCSKGKAPAKKYVLTSHTAIPTRRE